MSQKELHVCIGCGQRDTTSKSQLCGACRFGHSSRQNARENERAEGEEVWTSAGACLSARRVYPGPRSESDE